MIKFWDSSIDKQAYFLAGLITGTIFSIILLSLLSII
jgi:hypothetical protein